MRSKEVPRIVSSHPLLQALASDLEGGQESGLVQHYVEPLVVEDSLSRQKDVAETRGVTNGPRRLIIESLYPGLHFLAVCAFFEP